ncbi:MAG: bifunctional endoribonuclease/protein kinase ire1 [Phylliscum demangeonii]|nr:MAG: bifunctional endoribonuclease/protein kinase ire1 [Phylliscum demangeonii]
MPGRLPEGSKTVRPSVGLLLLLLPFVVAAQQQQQRHGDPPWPGSLVPRISLTNAFASSSNPSNARDHRLEVSRKSFKDTVISSDARAVATLAPASLKHAVRAPPARPSGASAEVAPPLPRSLQDWEVEDFVLLATVDGSIHARDRETGAPRWALEADRPMVETTYHSRNKSTSDDPRLEDRLLWVVEPIKDGNLYIYRSAPNPGLQNLGLTVRKLVEELSPYAGEDPPVVYTAEKKNTLFTIDAGNGRILKMFSAAGSAIEEKTKCRRVTGLEVPDEEDCASSGTLTLGRTEYVVGIQNRDTGEPICTLKYWEWGTNHRDEDLQAQYVATMDKKYVYSRHDGSIFAFDHAPVEERRTLYTQKFSSPVARVFDVVRPTQFDTRDAALIILPQPVGPTASADLSIHRSDPDDRIFLNRTDSGGWYALSEQSYPQVTGGAASAKCYRDDWQHVPIWDDLNSRHNDGLVGVHHVLSSPRRVPTLPTLSAPEHGPVKDMPTEVHPERLSIASTPALGNSRLLGYAAQNAVDIGILLPVLVCLVFLYLNRVKIAKVLYRTLDVEKIPGIKEVLMSPPRSPAAPDKSFSASFDGPSDDKSPSDEEGYETPTELTLTKTGHRPISNAGESRGDRPATNEPQAPSSPAQPKKKKTHRGQRGGVGRKKGKKESSGDGDALDQVVEEIKGIGRSLALEPDVTMPRLTGSSDITDVSGAFQINNLVVTDTVLGYGSHGTIVYKGSFEGREVAVKRMLLEFYDVASHEVGLLQESDDHPNVIRYFCRQQSAGFLYIALELCPASLHDVVEKPYEFVSLAQASSLDLPNVLYQIAAGVKHLHSLKIVHRDLKPQNILVAAPKVPRSGIVTNLPPRLLISDFGLCKKLEGDQSSFRATTAHAAGTSGWRAPELLVDDDPNQGPLATSESGHSCETSEPAIIDTLSNRRATRAIDIFSLGCVFFYVLSRGNHPFGDRYMREANIVKGQYNLSQLQELANYGYEATALIEAMLDHNPRRRPDAHTVMIHPFFWSAEKRLNFLVDVSDHFEWEPRDPPSANLQALEETALEVLGTDFLKRLDRAFIETLGKQRKYTGSRMLDLLRALRNKKNHFEDMPEHVRAHVGPLPEGYLQYWTVRFPMLLLQCYYVIVRCRLEELPRFKAYFALP